MFGFNPVWFIGVVESRMDPLMSGRCKVRCLGFHTDDTASLPTEELPWAQLLIPSNSDYEVKPPKEGSWVFGFFKDGNCRQEPMILSIIPGIPTVPPPQSKNIGFYDLGKDLETRPSPPEDLVSSGGSVVQVKDSEPKLYPLKSSENSEKPFMSNVTEEPDTSRIARKETIDKTVIQKRIDWLQKNVPKALSSGTWNEPQTEHDSKYPYNNVQQTESGHVFEIDDTKGKERISEQHRSGTFYEIHPDGKKVEKVLNDKFEIVHGNEYVLNFGELEICIKKSKGELVEGDSKIEIKGKHTEVVDGTHVTDSAGEMTLRAPRIDLN